jgi:hypothetical protein
MPKITLINMSNCFVVNMVIFEFLYILENLGIMSRRRLKNILRNV